MAWRVAPVAEHRRMAVILFSEQSIVTAVGVEDHRVDSITEVREGRAAALHVLRPVVCLSKLPLDLEILEEILEEV